MHDKEIIFSDYGIPWLDGEFDVDIDYENNTSIVNSFSLTGFMAGKDGDYSDWPVSLLDGIQMTRKSSMEYIKNDTGSYDQSDYVIYNDNGYYSFNGSSLQFTLIPATDFSDQIYIIYFVYYEDGSRDIPLIEPLNIS